MKQWFAGLSAWQKIAVVVFLWPFMAAWWFWTNPRFTTKTKAIVTAVAIPALAIIGAVDGATSTTAASTQTAAVSTQTTATTEPTLWNPLFEYDPDCPTSWSASTGITVGGCKSRAAAILRARRQSDYVDRLSYQNGFGHDVTTPDIGGACVGQNPDGRWTWHLSIKAPDDPTPCSNDPSGTEFVDLHIDRGSPPPPAKVMGSLDGPPGWQESLHHP